MTYTFKTTGHEPKPLLFTGKVYSEHFIELANKRVPKALKALELVGNLVNKSNYTYSKSQSDQIKKALREKVNEVCRKFDSKTGKENEFQLK